MRLANKWFLVIASSSILITFAFASKSVSAAAQCGANECESQGKYVCGTWGGVGVTGDMCCTGGGCPSWACEKGGDMRWEGATAWCYPEGKAEKRYNLCPVPKYEWVPENCNYIERCYDVPNYVWVCNYRTVCGLRIGSYCAYYETEAYNCRFENRPIERCYEDEVCSGGYNQFVGYEYVDNHQCGYRWVTEEGNPYRASQRAGDTCAYCTGTAVCPPGQTCLPGTGTTCDPNDWGSWSTCSAECGGGTQSRVNDCGTIESQACNTQACAPESLNIQGLIWNSTGLSCTSNPSESNEIVEGSSDGNVPSDISVTLDGVTSGNWDTSQSGYSYRFADIEPGQHVVTANVPDPVGYPNSKYRLACVNNQESGAAAVDAQSDPTSLHLGFSITSVGWFHVMDGDVFGGCTDDSCSDSISVGIPSSGSVLGGFEDALIGGEGTVFTNADASVQNSEGEDRYTSNSNEYYALNIESDNSIADTISFDPPSSANEISGGSCDSMFSGSLNPSNVYEASRDCVQDGIDNLSGDYSINSDGVVVIYVEGDGSSLAFSENFQSSSSDRRVMFVTTSPVEIGADIGEEAPTDSTEANIQASIISRAGITFLGKGEDEEDTTVIVEGPLVSTEGGISFNRDRILNNGYPAEVIRYNPLYLTALTDADHSGVRVFDISWNLQN